MYIIKLYNDGIETEIHGAKAKLRSGSLVRAINAIDSFTFSMIPSNPGFDKIKDYKTLVTVYNSKKNRVEFYGRVLCSTPEMDDSGHIYKEVVCESYLGFLCDSRQKYVVEKNWTVTELWQEILSAHNAQVEPHKQFLLGDVTVEDKNDNLYLGIQREDTWSTITSKLVETLGGEIRFRVVDGKTYIDHLVKIGELRATPIKLSHNMKAIRQENDPTAYISRLIPLGAKLTDEEGNETEFRVDITSVNDGLDYIEDVDAFNAHGTRVEYAYFDDVNTPNILKTKGTDYLREHNRVKVKYSITYVDLSLIGIDIDDIDVYDYYPIVNPLLGIDDTARVIKKTTDVCDETKSSIEVGDKFKTLSDIQSSQSSALDRLDNSVGKIESSYVPKNELISESTVTNSKIAQTESSIQAWVEELYSKKTTVEEFSRELMAKLELQKDEFSVKFTQAETKLNEIDGDLQTKYNLITKYFTFDINGLVIGAVDENGVPSPNKVVIDNDEITIMVNGTPVQKFDAEGNALIPQLTVSEMLSVFGMKWTEDDTHINCDYVG